MHVLIPHVFPALIPNRMRANVFGHYSQCEDAGRVNVTYSITSAPSQNARIAFDTYIYNQDAPNRKNSTHWLNRLYTYGESFSGSGGWMGNSTGKHAQKCLKTS